MLTDNQKQIAEGVKELAKYALSFIPEGQAKEFTDLAFTEVGALADGQIATVADAIDGAVKVACGIVVESVKDPVKAEHICELIRDLGDLGKAGQAGKVGEVITKIIEIAHDSTVIKHDKKP